MKNKHVILSIATILILVAILSASSVFAADDDCWATDDGMHVWSEWETVRKPTAYVKGEKERYCLECEETETKAIPKRKITAVEKKVRGVAIAYLKAAKRYNIKKMNKCFAKKPKKYGYPTKRINWVYKKYNKKIKWKVKNITGSKKAYTVKMSVTRPDFYNQAYDAFSETVWWGFYKLLNTSKEPSSAKLGNMILKKYNAKVKKCKKKTSTDTVNFKIIKTKKGWKIETKSRTMVDIATAFFHKATDDANEDYQNDLEEGNF